MKGQSKSKKKTSKKGKGATKTKADEKSLAQIDDGQDQDVQEDDDSSESEDDDDDSDVEMEPVAEDEQILVMNNERFTVPEILFNPSDIGMDQAGIPEAIVDAISSCDEGKRRVSSKIRREHVLIK